MTRINPSRIANRIGRIVCAVLLSGLVIAISEIPGDVWNDSLTSFTVPIGIYLNLLLETGVWALFGLFVMPVAYILLWGVSRRFSQLRTWQTLCVLSVLVSVALAAVEPSVGYQSFVFDTLGGLRFAGAVLLSIALVEAGANGKFTGIYSGRPAMTVVGGTFLCIGAAVLVLVASVTAAGVVAESARLVDTMSDEERYEQELEDERNAVIADADEDTEPTPDYTDVPSEFVSLADDADDHHLLKHDDPEPPADHENETSVAPVETHVGTEYFEAQSIEFETENGTEMVEGHYYLEFDPDMNTFRTLATITA